MEPGPANQNEFFPQKSFITDRNTPQHPPSDDPAGEEAGCGGPGQAWLYVFCVCKAGWTYCQIL
jgi:hypothetical protein